MHQLTAAHQTLAFGSVVKVMRRDTGAVLNGRSVVAVGDLGRREELAAGAQLHVDLEPDHDLVVGMAAHVGSSGRSR